MNRERLLTIIKAPLITEKSSMLASNLNQVAFKVSLDANKSEIKNFDLYLLTGRNSRKNLIEQLKNLDIYVYFKNIFNVNTSNMIAEKKAVLKSHQPEYFVGDTEFDYLACKDLPVKFFCVSNGFRNYDFLKKNLPKIVVAPSFAVLLWFVYGFIAWTFYVSLTKSKLLPNYNS